jgi:hypothetical protein
MKSKVVLPRVYNNPSGSDKFEKFVGLPKISYSQIDSWNNPDYKGEYFESYFLGIGDSGNIFTHFGSLVGEWFEKGQDESGELSESDIEVLSSIGRPANCEYEREVVIVRPLGYAIQGFIDRARTIVDESDKKQIEVIDFKTGNIEKKSSFYGGNDYQQTTLYTFGLIEEGEDVVWSGVVMLGRNGNGSEKSPLRLNGDVLSIETPYSEDRIDLFFNKCDKTVEEISEYYKFYNKFFVD